MYLSEEEINYIINELGEERESYFNSFTPPIIQTSNFVFNKVEDIRQCNLKGFEYNKYSYGRSHNPTTDILRKKLAALDGAEDALIFNSGSSAIFAALTTFAKPNSHIICIDKPYYRAEQICNKYLSNFGIETTFVDGSLESFINNTKPNTNIFYLETPNSWNYSIQDLEQISKFAKEKGILTICDNTYCSPIYQRPIFLGIDIVLQSASKYLNGHSDILAGVVCGTKKNIKKIYELIYSTSGNGLTPINSWLFLKGLRTFPLRIKTICENTKQIKIFLENNSKINKILFPFDKNFERNNIAKQQMKDAFGLITFTLKNSSLQKIENFCNALQKIKMAFSWGGYESLIMPYCSNFKTEDFNPIIENHNNIRLYIGLEPPKVIIEDIQQALEKIN